MELMFKDKFYPSDQLTISSDLINDSLLIDLEEDGEVNSFIINRENSVHMANEILKFWSENKKYKFMEG